MREVILPSGTLVLNTREEWEIYNDKSSLESTKVILDLGHEPEVSLETILHAMAAMIDAQEVAHMGFVAKIESMQAEINNLRDEIEHMKTHHMI